MLPVFNEEMSLVIAGLAMNADSMWKPRGVVTQSATAIRLADFDAGQSDWVSGGIWHSGVSSFTHFHQQKTPIF